MSGPVCICCCLPLQVPAGGQHVSFIWHTHPVWLGCMLLLMMLSAQHVT